MGNHRLSKPTPESEMLSLAVHVLSITQPLREVDCLIVLPGEGEDWRVRDAIRTRETLGIRFLLIAPFNTGEKTTREMTIELLRQEFGLTIEEGVVIGGHVEHTPGQAEWFIEMVKKMSLASAVVSASPYHIVRAYLTFIKFLAKENLKVRLFPRATPVSPFEMVPESGMDSFGLIHGEAERILRYQEKGDVATLDELKNYLRWLYAQ